MRSLSAQVRRLRGSASEPGQSTHVSVRAQGAERRVPQVSGPASCKCDDAPDSGRGSANMTGSTDGSQWALRGVCRGARQVRTELRRHSPKPTGIPRSRQAFPEADRHSPKPTGFPRTAAIPRTFSRLAGRPSAPFLLQAAVNGVFALAVRPCVGSRAWTREPRASRAPGSRSAAGGVAFGPRHSRARCGSRNGTRSPESRPGTHDPRPWSDRGAQNATHGCVPRPAPQHAGNQTRRGARNATHIDVSRPAPRNDGESTLRARRTRARPRDWSASLAPITA
jgi:hypothetical protein